MTTDKRPTPAQIIEAIDDVTSGRIVRRTWPGIVRIERNEDGETIVTNLEEIK